MQAAFDTVSTRGSKSRQESEMDIPMSSWMTEGRTGGIVPLSVEEIDLVSGGKSAVPTKSLWERFCDWLMGDGPRPATQPVQTITGADLAMLEKTCVESGGNFSFSSSATNGNTNLRMVNANGSYVDIVVSCTQP
jgi:hypothetical protein